MGCVRCGGGTLVFRTTEEQTKSRLHGYFLAALVVLVQLVWGGLLVYLGVRYL
jgi:hypothetical protein